MLSGANAMMMAESEGERMSDPTQWKQNTESSHARAIRKGALAKETNRLEGSRIAKTPMETDGAADKPLSTRKLTIEAYE